MAGEIPGISNNRAQMPSFVDNLQTLTKSLVNTEKGTEQVKLVASLLADASLNITGPKVSTKDAPGATSTGATNVPALDNPGDVKNLQANLEKLIAYLQLDNDERQAELARERIETQKDSLSSEHKDRSEKIEKSLKDMDKAAEAAKRNRIFGWIMAAIAVVAAVVMSVASMGVAVGPCIGAVLAVGAMVLQETGAMDTITEKLAKALEDAGMGSNQAKMWASIIITAAILVASLAAGGIGSAAQGASSAAQNLSKTAETIMKLAQSAQKWVSGAQKVMTAGTLVSNTVGAVETFNAGKSQAELTETEKYMQIIRQQLEESEEELQAILEMLQNNIGQLAELLSSETNTMDEIASKIGAMA